MLFRSVVIIRVGVVLDMGGGPVEGGALHGHGTPDQEDGFEPRMGLKTFVGQHPVVTEGDAQGPHQKEGQKERDIHPCDVGVPKEDDGGDHPEDGEPNQSQKNGLGQRSRGVGVADGTAQAVSFAYIPNGGKRSWKIYSNCYKFVTCNG